MSILALSFGALALASTSLVAVLGGSNHGLLGNHTVQKAGTAENVSTPYSLILNGDAGYNGEASKTVLSSLGNPLEIGFSDPAKFGKASKGVGRLLDFRRRGVSIHLHEVKRRLRNLR